ncbi:hypothetical protein Nepgr_017854 [Nepenthes gracilis]|uniref:Uncharacterized protein n=1 Tax=Nepenthes gracilis TaxID=150966 RepID=A0AAD3SR94_NEPGR|nr:hypothetical protein Nepgr_017854 [Nepenthes gracilis]
MRWSLVSFFIFCICWLLKNILLLKWEAHAVYNRFSDKILRAGFQWYFLGLLSGTYWDIFKPEAEKNGQKKDTPQAEGTASSADKRASGDSEKTKVDTEDKKIIKDIKAGMLSKDSTLYNLKRMARVFVNIAEISSRDQEDDISKTLEKCGEEIEDHTREMKEEDLEVFGVEGNDKKLLYDELKGEDPHVRAHKNCLAMGYTLTDAKEVVHCLDMIMSAAVIAVIIIAWLLLTGVATTKLLVLIASPFLAVTFIFGDTCRTLFEGIMFAFVKHPFDVGDLCIIDNCQWKSVKMSESEAPKLYVNKPKKAHVKQFQQQQQQQLKAKEMQSSASTAAAASSSMSGQGSASKPPEPPKESFLRRHKFLWPLLLTVNVAVGAYLYTRTKQKDKVVEEDAPEASTPPPPPPPPPTEKPPPPVAAAEPSKLQEPIPENQQRELFKWMLEEKRKANPKDPEEKKRIDEEKAILKQFLRAKSIPAI